MKKTWIIIAVVVIIVIMVYSFFKGTYNNMVTKNETVKASWSLVVTDYQRRMDLIPNLVSTVKGYADFEQQTLTQVIEARAKATSVNINPQNMDANAMKQFQESQGALSSALSRLLVTIEKYPDLKANQNFLELQAQLEGTENRISNARRKFNEATQDYNTYVRMFPRNMVAGMFNFGQLPYFEADAGAEKAPKVEF